MTEPPAAHVRPSGRPAGGRGFLERARPRLEPWIALALCAGVIAAWALERLVPDPDGGPAFAPDWLPLVAAGMAAAAFLPPDGSTSWGRRRRTFGWTGLLLSVWSANGLPFDLLTLFGLIGHRTASGAVVLSTVYWPGLAMRTLALGTAILLARRLLTRPAVPSVPHPAVWYGHAAFVLALPYPLLRLHWALGGTLGLDRPGAAAAGWEPLLIAIPWALAAALSLLLVSPRSWIPRRLLVAAGWIATVIVGMIGPAAFWGFLRALTGDGHTATGEIELWVFGLFYGSWFLWAIAAGAATRSYQLRSAGLGLGSST